MPETKRITLTIRVDQFDTLEEMAESDDPRWDSKSEAARFLIDRADEADEMETEIQRLKNEKEALVGQYQESQELAKQDDESSIDDETFMDRLKWLFRGSS